MVKILALYILVMFITGCLQSENATSKSIKGCEKVIASFCGDLKFAKEPSFKQCIASNKYKIKEQCIYQLNQGIPPEKRITKIETRYEGLKPDQFPKDVCVDELMEVCSTIDGKKFQDEYVACLHRRRKDMSEKCVLYLISIGVLKQPGDEGYSFIDQFPHWQESKK